MSSRPVDAREKTSVLQAGPDSEARDGSRVEVEPLSLYRRGESSSLTPVLSSVRPVPRGAARACKMSSVVRYAIPPIEFSVADRTGIAYNSQAMPSGS